MNKKSKQILFWTPRILGIAFILFTTLFSFDVLGEGYGFWKTIFALLMHLIPTFTLIVVLLTAWKWEWIGGIIFLVLAVVYIFLTWGRFPFITYVIMCSPLVLISALFFINWKYKKEIQLK